MFSSTATGRPQCGQREPGRSSDNSSAGAGVSPRSSAHWTDQSRSIMRGRRWMTTLRKLPIIRPNRSEAAMNGPPGCSRASMRVYTTAPSLKIGRYMAITMPPMRTPSTTMIKGSSRLDSASTASSTSAS